MNSQLASQGQIRKLLIADAYSQENADTAYSNLTHTYNEFLIAFGNNHNVQIYVLFDLEGSKTAVIKKNKCLKTLPNGSALWAICLNYDDSHTRLNTQWIQDVIITTKDNTCLYDQVGVFTNAAAQESGLGDRQAKVLTETIPGLSITSAKLPCSGGNLLLGEINDIRYGFTCVTDKVALKNICRLFNISLEYLFSPEKVDPKNDPHLFHIDRFLTIVGSTASHEKQHLILIGQPEKAYPEIKVPNDTALMIQVLFEEILEFIQKTKLPLIVERIPLLFMDFASRIISLSFNNCVVENSVPPSAVSPVLYFPKFNRTLYAHVNNQADSELISYYTIKNNIPGFVAADLERDILRSQHNGDSNLIRKMLNEQSDKIVDDCKSRILTLLLKYKIRKESVYFIDYNFKKPSSKGGALHCLTKVLLRE